jgi:hypothetical protein
MTPIPNPYFVIASAQGRVAIQHDVANRALKLAPARVGLLEKPGFAGRSNPTTPPPAAISG